MDNELPDFLNYSPADVLKMGVERELDPVSIAEGLKTHRANLEDYGRKHAPESYWEGALTLDKDTEAALGQVRLSAERAALRQALPDEADRGRLAEQLAASDYDPAGVDKDLQPVLEQVRKVREDPAFALPARVYGGAVKVGDTTLARYALRDASDDMVDVSLQLPDDSTAFARVPKVRPGEVQAELARREQLVGEAFQEAERLKKGVAVDPLGGFIGSDVSAQNRLEAARADYLALLRGGAVHLLGERVRDELKRPEWESRVGTTAGWTEFTKGLADATLTSGALVSRLAGQDDWLRGLAEAQDNLDTALPGSTRRRLEGGVWNDSVSGAQRALGTMAPQLVGGGVTRIATQRAAGNALTELALAGGEASQAPRALTELARQQSGRLGVAGAGMTASAAGGAYLETQRLIDAAEADGDTERANRLRWGRDVHALLTGAAEGAVERLGAAQAFNVTARGVRRLGLDLGAEAVEEPLTGLTQRGIVDPLTLGERRDVTAPLAEEALTGLLAAGPLVTGSLTLNRLAGRQEAPETAEGTPATVEGAPIQPEAPDAGSLQAAQTAGNVPDPEPLVTLTAQRALVEAGRKPAMMVDGVKVADLPPELAGTLRWIDTAAGAVGFRQEVFSEGEARTLAEDPKLRGRLLGYTAAPPPAAPDRLVVVDDPAGAEVVSLPADEATADAAAGSLAVMADPASGHALTVLPADQAGVLQGQRAAARREEANTGRARMAERVLVRAGVEADVAAEFAARINAELPADLPAEAYREQLLQAFEQAGGQLPGSVAAPYVEQAAAYEAQGASPAEAAQHAANAKAANAAALNALHARNRALLEETRSGRTAPDAVEPELSGSDQQSPPGRAPRDEAGQPPELAATPAAAAGSAEPAAADPSPAPKRRSYGVKIRRRPDGVPDILDWLSEQGSIERPPRLKRDRMGRATNARGEHDALRRLRQEWPAYYSALTKPQGRQVDALAQVAYEEGLIAAPDVDQLIEAIQAAIGQRRGLGAELRAREKAEGAAEAREVRQGKRQAAAWKKANQPDKGTAPIPSDEMIPGMVLDVDGEPLTVVDVEYDEDGNWQGALLEDGDRFGRQWIANGELVHADSVKLPERPAAEPDPFDMQDDEAEAEAAPAAAPEAAPAAAARAGGNLFDEGSMPFNLVAETAEDVQKREAAQAAYEAEQRAREAEEARKIAEGQQGRLFGDTMSNINQAQLPRQQTGAGPIRAPGHLVTLAQIRKHLLAAAGLPSLGLGRFMVRALGIYKLKAQTIRQKALNDIPTLAHEIGHAVHFKFLGANPRVAESWGGRFDAELLPLGRVTSLPTYTVAKVRAEGVAEFARLWLTDPAAALAAAPRFSAHWRAELQAKAPEVLAALDDGQAMIADYIALTDWQKAKAQIAFDPASLRPSKTVGEWLRRAYATWVNTLQPAQDVLKRVAQLDPKLSRTAARINDWMENHRGGWQSKASADLFVNQTSLSGKVIGPSLKAILADLRPKDHEDFSTYLAVKRARELQARGIKSGFDGVQIPAAEMAAFEKRFESTRQKLLTFQDNALRMLVDSGLLSAETHRQMREANRDYVPFYRIYEGLTGTRTGAEAGRNGGGYVDNASGVRRIKGSDLAIVDPLQSVMRNVYVFRKLAEQNHIGVQFFDLVQSLQGHGQFADSIAASKVPTRVTHQQVLDKLIEAGVIDNAADLPIGADLTITLWHAMHRPKGKMGEIIVHKGGEAQHWELKDAMLYNALKTADADAVRFFKASPALTKVLTWPTQVLRFFATGGNPIFAARNWLRDQNTAAVNSQTGFVPFWDGVIGAYKVIKRHPDYLRWIQAGGKYAGLVTNDQAFSALVEDVMPQDPGARAMMRGLANPRHLKRVLTITGEILEEATRVQEFSRGLSQGKTDMEAANLSKAVSLNFARAGEASRALNMVIAFFNAGVQDLDLVVRQHLDPKRRGTVMMKGLLYITLPSLLCWALGKDDEEIQSLPEWRRNFFWNFNLGRLAKALGRPGFILSLPKPFLMGAIYGTAVERALDAATGRDPNGAKKAARNILANTIFHGDLVSGFTALQPAMEVMTNNDPFTGGPVVPEHMENLPKPMQFTLQTSETAKLLGRATGQSPMVIDHLVGGYFAGLGKMSVAGLDWALTKIGAGNGAPGPAKDLFEYQPFRSFAGSPYEASVFVGRFYAAASDMEGLMRTWKAQGQLMTTDEQRRFWDSKGQEILAYERIVNGRTKLTAAGEVRQMQKHLSELNRAMKTVHASATLSPEEKRARLIELSQQRNAAAETGFKSLFPEPVRKRHY